MVNHSILFEKLEHYGMKGLPLQLFQSYLSNRKQYVSYNNTPSYITTNKYGVPPRLSTGATIVYNTC